MKLELDVIDIAGETPPVPEGVIPVGPGKSCGSGCGSHAAELNYGRRKTPSERKPKVEIEFASRCLNLDAIPSRGMMVTNIDLDLTVECNLRCTYCFKEKWNEHMEEQVAFDAITWLLHASGEEDAYVNFMGGEPLIRFKLIQRIVPFGKRRAWQLGKQIHFGMTTNGTLVTDEVVSFWKQWGLGFHTSIDGTPDIQDKNRPTTGGRGSARLVEKAVPKVLDYAPRTTARCTVVPNNAGSMSKSYQYFRSLGYLDIAFVPGGPSLWNTETIQRYEDDFYRVGELLMEDWRHGLLVNVKGIDDYASSQVVKTRNANPCGAGRGMILVDIHGDMWPCHRWNKETEAGWRIGSIYEQFDDEARKSLDVPSFIDLLENDCANCEAKLMCSGGCAAENLEETGTVYRRHENACALERVWARVGRHVHETMVAEGNQTYFGMYLKKQESRVGVFH